MDSSTSQINQQKLDAAVATHLQSALTNFNASVQAIQSLLPATLADSFSAAQNHATIELPPVLDQEVKKERVVKPAIQKGMHSSYISPVNVYESANHPFSKLQQQELAILVKEAAAHFADLTKSYHEQDSYKIQKMIDYVWWKCDSETQDLLAMAKPRNWPIKTMLQNFICSYHRRFAKKRAENSESHPVLQPGPSLQPRRPITPPTLVMPNPDPHLPASNTHPEKKRKAPKDEERGNKETENVKQAKAKTANASKKGKRAN